MKTIAAAHREHAKREAQLEVKLAWQEEDNLQLQERMSAMRDKYEGAYNQMAKEQAARQAEIEQHQEEQRGEERKASLALDELRSREREARAELERQQVECTLALQKNREHAKSEMEAVRQGLAGGLHRLGAGDPCGGGKDGDS